MAIDFNPMLARSLAKEATATQGAYGLGQSLASPQGIDGLLKMFNKGKTGAENAKEITSEYGNKLKQGIAKKKDSFLDFVKNAPSNLKQNMIDDKGLFQGGMNPRLFGRARDEMDIMSSKIKGGFQPALPEPSRPDLNPNSQAMLDNLNNQNMPEALPFAPSSKFSYDQFLKDEETTKKQDELMQYNLTGGNTLGGINTGDARGETDNVYNYDFTTDVMALPTSEAFVNKINRTNLVKPESNNNVPLHKDYGNIIKRYQEDSDRNLLYDNRNQSLQEFLGNSEPKLNQEQLDNINNMALNSIVGTRAPYAQQMMKNIPGLLGLGRNIKKLPPYNVGGQTSFDF